MSTVLTLGAVVPRLRVRITRNSVQQFAVDVLHADGTPLLPADLVGKTAVLEIGTPGTPLTWSATWDTVVPHRAVWTITAAMSSAHGARERRAVLALVSSSDRQVLAEGSTDLC